jgi:uncharacterized membrane protein YkoI
MRTWLKLPAAIGFAALLLAAPSIAGADDDNDDDDHDLARELYEHGEIRALSQILRTVGERAPGDVVAVDLVKLDNRWVYRFQVVEADGRRVIVDVDAGAGIIREESDD